MENKIESPDYQLMDISEACTVTSQESISENELNGDKSADQIVTVTKNMNSLHLTTTSSSTKDSDKENIENRNTITSPSIFQKLTPADHHPLMDEELLEDVCNNSRVSNFPDVVPFIEQQHQQPLRLAKPISKGAAADLVNSVNNNINEGKIRKPMYREPSPDLNDFLSDSEPDLSQYQAECDASFQTVALVSVTSQHQASRLQQSSSSPKFLNLDLPSRSRKIQQSGGFKFEDDASSPEELSFRGDDVDDDDDLLTTETYNNKNVNGKFSNVQCAPEKIHLKFAFTECIPEYTAAEEARNVRNYGIITMPDGKTREIDLKVIEPYKRILSHGGYLKAGGHNAIIVFSACHLPDRSRKDYNYVMNNLFYYVVKTLEQLVTEDYVLVYLHGASNRKNSPPFPWLKKCYQLLDRRLRKSLKSCYIVHPTFWLKSLIWMTRPFISSKFWRKMVYVQSLQELYQLVPVEKNSIPDKVLTFNARHSS